MFIDQYYLILVVPAIIISLFAQFKVKSTFSKYSKIASKRGISGAQAAQLLLRANDITDVSIEHVSGNLTDHYAPTQKVLRLSDSVYSKTSIAAIGVAAHETGHAIQHARNYAPLWLRSAIVPIASFGSRFGPLLAILGLGFGYGSSSGIGNILIELGLILFGCSVLFTLITLPVEFNASRRAINILRQTGTLTEAELKDTKKVLSAAAMTYVASALTAIASFLRILLIARNRRR
ncbi:MAG: zinc metallopeptidase [Treponema sp.]|nr:zinc metallopeptidase [Treponema sp.]